MGRKKLKSALNRALLKGGANVGKNESEYFTKMEMEFGWNGIFYGKNGIQHVLTEFGYSLDYYEPTKNIVVEYDEPRHYVRNELRQKDVKRMDNIKFLLKCKFLRYNEKSGELKEY